MNQERVCRLHCCSWLIHCTKINNKRWRVHSVLSVNIGFDVTVFVWAVWVSSLLLVWPVHSYVSPVSMLISLKLFCNELVSSASCFIECGRKLSSGLYLSCHFTVGHPLELLFCLKLEDRSISTSVREAFWQTNILLLQANSVNLWWVFLGNFGLQNEIRLLVQSLWLVPFSLSNKKSKGVQFLSSWFFACVKMNLSSNRNCLKRKSLV